MALRGRHLVGCEQGAERTQGEYENRMGDANMIKRTRVVESAILLALVGLVGRGNALGVEQQRAFVEGELVVRLTMELPVAPEQFFDAWTTAEQLVEWFPSWAEMTVTEGGEYRFGWEGWDDQWTGTYVAVDRPNRIVFTWHPPAAVFPQGAYETIVTPSSHFRDGSTCRFTGIHFPLS